MSTRCPRFAPAFTVGLALLVLLPCFAAQGHDTETAGGELRLALSVERVGLAFDHVDIPFRQRLILVGVHGGYVFPPRFNEKPQLYPEARIGAALVTGGSYRTGNAGYQRLTLRELTIGGRATVSAGMGARMGTKDASIRLFLAPAFDWLAVHRNNTALSPVRGYRAVGALARLSVEAALNETLRLHAGFGAEAYPFGRMSGTYTEFVNATAYSASLGVRLR